MSPAQIDTMTPSELIQDLKIAMAKYERDYKRFLELYGANSGAVLEVSTRINTLRNAIHTLQAENVKAMASAASKK